MLEMYAKMFPSETVTDKHGEIYLRRDLADISKIESILTITRLISVFEHFETAEEAMKTF